MSKIFLIFLKVKAHGTSQTPLITVPIVVSPNGTHSWPSTLRKLIFCIFTHIVSITLSFIAWNTETCISPTKPISYAATKFAFELHKIFSMFGTILNRYIVAAWTNQFFWLETFYCSLIFIGGSHTVLPTSKVRIFALKTHKVCVYDHRILICLSVIG